MCSFQHHSSGSYLCVLLSPLLSIFVFLYCFPLCRCVPPALAPLSFLLLTDVPVCVSKQPRDLIFISLPSLPFVFCFNSLLFCSCNVHLSSSSTVLTRNRFLSQFLRSTWPFVALNIDDESVNSAYTVRLTCKPVAPWQIANVVGASTESGKNVLHC